MKVLNLGCAQAHVFEGWFASEEDFQTQLARGLLECPLCGDRHIEKRLSAPRLNLRAQTVQEPKTVAEASPASAAEALPAEVQAMVLKAVREVISKTEDVGERFVSEARRMHHGEVEPRSIRGRATLDDAVALSEEGIEVMPLPELDVFKHTLQ